MASDAPRCILAPMAGTIGYKGQTRISQMRCALGLLLAMGCSDKTPVAPACESCLGDAMGSRDILAAIDAALGDTPPPEDRPVDASVGPVDVGPPMAPAPPPCAGTAEAMLPGTPGWRVLQMARPLAQLSFQITALGPVSQQGEIFMASRASVEPDAEQNIFSWGPAGERIVLAAAAYPMAGASHEGRLAASMAWAPWGPDVALLLADTGAVCMGVRSQCEGEFEGKMNGRIFEVDSQTGVTKVLVHKGTLIDPTGIATHQASGLVVIADRGRNDAPGDGALYRYTQGGPELEPLAENIDPLDVAIRKDGAIVWSSDARTKVPGLFWRNADASGTVSGPAGIPVSGTLAFDPEQNLFVANGGKLILLVDEDHDFHIESVQTVIAQGVRKLTIAQDGQIFVSHGPTGAQKISRVCRGPDQP